MGFLLTFDALDKYALHELLCNNHDMHANSCNKVQHRWFGLVCMQVMNHLSCTEHPGESPECSNQQLAGTWSAQLADSYDILK